MSHTRGPWYVGRGNAVCAEVSAGHRYTDLDLEYYGGHLVAESIVLPENARLLAAAPALLDALEALLADALHNGYDETHQEIRDARAAIRQARGQP